MKKKEFASGVEKAWSKLPTLGKGATPLSGRIVLGLFSPHLLRELSHVILGHLPQLYLIIVVVPK